MTRAILVAAGIVGMLWAQVARSDTLAEVRERGELLCGVSDSIAGFASEDISGTWQGFDVDFCRALATVVLGDPQAVRFVPTGGEDRFEVLAEGEVDLLARNTTWTYSRDAGAGVDFAGVVYYDGQGFMVPRAMNVSSARDLDDVRICVKSGTTSESNLDDFFRRNNVTYTPVTEGSDEAVRDRYLAGECDAYTADASALAALRATFVAPADHVILPEIISKEPLGPVVRQEDGAWADVVRWTLFALIAAEEMGVTSANVSDLASGPTDKPEVNRLLGTEGDIGAPLGLPPDWVAMVVAAVGNYGEIFARNIGADTPIGLARGLNAQWTNGGLIYAPPFR